MLKNGTYLLPVPAPFDVGTNGESTKNVSDHRLQLSYNRIMLRRDLNSTCSERIKRRIGVGEVDIEVENGSCCSNSQARIVNQ